MDTDRVETVSQQCLICHAVWLCRGPQEAACWTGPEVSELIALHLRSVAEDALFSDTKRGK